MIKKKDSEEVDHSKKRLPPGPKRLPIIGNLHQLGQSPHRSLSRLSDEFGPIMFLQLGTVPTVVVSSADIAQEIFKSHDLVFSNRPVIASAKKISYNCSDVSFSAYGEYWREIRKILVLELLSGKRVQSFKAVMQEEVENMMDFIASYTSSSSFSTAHSPMINLNELTILLTNRVVCRVAFGKSGGGDGEDIIGGDHGKSRFHEIIHETQSLLGEVNFADYLPWMWWLNKMNGFDSRLDKNFRELDSFFDKVIEEHVDPERVKFDEHEDVVDVLLRLQKDPTQALSLNNDGLKGILADIFIAGTSTSAATLVWTMTQLIKNPSVMQKAQEELRQVVKEKQRVHETDLPKLEYLKLVIKESWRLHPPAPLLVPRETLERCVIGGYTIPALTKVFINATSIAMDSKYWENPSEFRPERFMNSKVDYRGQNFEYIPFGAGRRSCPGLNFASCLVELALANLLYCFDWGLPEGIRAEDIDMEESLGITMTKKTPLCLIASSP